LCLWGWACLHVSICDALVVMLVVFGGMVGVWLVVVFVFVLAVNVGTGCCIARLNLPGWDHTAGGDVCFLGKHTLANRIIVICFPFVCLGNTICVPSKQFLFMFANICFPRKQTSPPAVLVGICEGWWVGGGGSKFWLCFCGHIGCIAVQGGE